MQAGKIVESGEAEELYQNPKQTYTRELLEAVPKGDLESLQARFES
jgi:peptide/nickel transport system ATP-binding protein